MATTVRDLLCAIQHLANGSIIVFAPSRPIVSIEACPAQVTIAAIALNQLWTLAEIGHILREVAATLRDKGTKVTRHFKAYRITLIDFWYLSTLKQARIHILTFMAQEGEPGIVVDASATPFQFFIRYLQIISQLLGRALHAMTETNRMHLCTGQSRKCQNRHRVGVVQYPGCGA